MMTTQEFRGTLRQAMADFDAATPEQCEKEKTRLVAPKMVSVRQEAAEAAEAAGRNPCREVAHPADCPGGCEPRIGDQVVCTDDSASFGRLRKGETYDVTAAYDGAPTVEVRGSYHSIERFRLRGPR